LARKLPVANLRTNGSLTGVSVKSKSASSLASGSLGDDHGRLLKEHTFTLIAHMIERTTIMDSSDLAALDFRPI